MRDGATGTAAGPRTLPALRLMDRFVLRGTGFPIDLLDRLRFPRTAAATAELLAARTELGGLAPRVDEALADASRAARDAGDQLTVAAVRRMRKAVGARRRVAPTAGEHPAAPVLAWDAACERVLAAEVAVAAAYEEELRRGRGTLRELFLRDDVQEALWLSNPDMFDAHWPTFLKYWRPDRRDSRIKRLERTLYTYLQRFAAKNDTTSFFGPLNYGTFTATGPAECRIGPRRIRARRGFFAFWAAEAIVRRLQADLDAPDEAFALDPATLGPLDDAAAWLRGRPDDAARNTALRHVEDLRRMVEEFAAAQLPRRRELLAAAERIFAAIVGPHDAGRRGGDGRMFRDRALLYEECLGDLERLHLTEAHRARIAAALSPVAEMCAEYARRRTADLRVAGAALLRELSPDGTPVSLARFAAAWHRRHPDGPAIPAADRFGVELTELVERRRSGDVARLSADDVSALCVTPGDPVVMSPDIMIAADGFAAVARGDYRIVIGEVHHGAQPVGWMLTFADDPEAWRRAVEAHLPPPDAVEPANLVLGRRMKVAPPRFPGPSLGTREGLGDHSLSALVVLPGPDGPRLHAPGIDRPLRCYAPSHGVGRQYGVFACFSYPLADLPRVRTGRHTPRIVVGEVTVQRRRWVIPADRLPDTTSTGSSHHLFVACAAFRAEHRLPERVFARSAGEAKPVFVDFGSAFSLEVLAQLCADAARQSPPELMFEEVSPDMDELWLRRGDGRYCTELRTVCSVPGDGAA